MSFLWSLLVVLTVLLSPAQAQVPASPAAWGPGPEVASAKAPDTSALTEGRDKKNAEQAAADEEEERRRKEKLARVIVLKWMGTTPDYRDQTVQRNVKSRIVRPDAQFFPEVDLYQNGRKVSGNVVPAQQPATVPPQNIQRVRTAIDEVAAVPWNAMSPADWGFKAQDLRALVELIWFVDRVDLREPLFLLYAQIGRAAENQNQNIPPFYEEVGRLNVNYYFYMAAVLAHQDPALMSKLTDQELNGSISGYLQQLQQGAYPTLKVDFELEGEDFDLDTFKSEYKVYLNGMETDPSDQGQIEIFLGRTDIYLRRNDSGHGMSERLEVSKLVDKIYFVRETARKRMGYDFIEQLFLHPNECTPALDGDILNYLSIYAKIHEKAEIYIAVPHKGNPNSVWVWRWDRPSASLQLVGGGNDGFPVRFALVLSGGVMFNSLTIGYDPTRIVQGPDGEITFGDPSNFGESAKNAFDFENEPVMIPLNVELRGHYNRLMVAIGGEFGFNAKPDEAPWVERYYLHGRSKSEADVVKEDCESSGDGCSEVYNTVKINRDLYMGAAVVLGRDAGIGLGPRLGFRAGWTNVPHAVQATGHFGWTLDAPGIGNLGDRVRPFLDVDARMGGSFPLKNSIVLDGSDTYRVGLIYGLMGGIGTTF